MTKTKTKTKTKAAILKLDKLTDKIILGYKKNDNLIAQAVRVYLARKRQTSAKTKTRSEVNLTKAKVWRQKGTGRARHGSRSAPIFVKGGVSHGPTGEQNYKLKLPKKMRQRAIISALADKVKGDKIGVLAGLEKLSGKTKEFAGSLVTIGVKPEKILIVYDSLEAKTLLAGKNLPYLTFVRVGSLNALDILKAKLLLLTPDSINKLGKNGLKPSN